MSEEFAVRMQRTDAPTLGRLRGQSGIHVCEMENHLWLHVQQITDELQTSLRTLPGRRYTVLPDRQLVPIDARLPRGYLPDGPWASLPQWMELQLSTPAMSGVLSKKCPLSFVRATQEDESNVIRANIDHWHDYAASAPRVRLDRLSFAMNEGQNVVVRGTPLPPIPGVRYVERAGVAVQAGWTWRPAVQPEVLREFLALANDDLALLHASGSWDRISGDDFVRATRSAVRESAQG